MGGFKRSYVLAAQPGQRRRITLRLRRKLCGRREPGCDRERNAIEKIAAGEHQVTGIRNAGVRESPFLTPDVLIPDS